MQSVKKFYTPQNKRFPTNRLKKQNKELPPYGQFLILLWREVICLRSKHTIKELATVGELLGEKRS